MKEDIFVYNDEVKDYRDPFYSQHGVKLSPNRIRNNMAHSAALFVEPNDKKSHKKCRDKDIVVLSSQDLEMDTWKFMWQTREILLYLQLAENYDKRHGPR